MMDEQRDSPSQEPSPEEMLVNYLEDADEARALPGELPTGSRTESGRGFLDAIIEPLALENATGTGKRAPRAASRRFGKFELLDELGRGGMGVVYRGTDLDAGRSVAVKMILAGDFASPSALERFRAEARAAAALEHPGVVTIYDTGDVEGQPFIAMELLEGGSLSKHLPQLGGSPRAAAELALHVARAVDAAHSRNILHRDLKPANIIFDVGGHPVVTDFGLARQIGSPTELTTSGALLGTLLYMAPEQAERSGRTLTPAADVYSLGAILYEALTGRPPFRGSWAPEMLRQLLYDEPVVPSKLEPNVPRALDAICLKCLEKSPARRYRSAGELADDLDRYLDSKPIEARAPSRLERALKWARRRPTAAALVVLVALILLGIPVAMLWYSEELRQRASVLEARDALSRRYVYAARLNLAYDALERNSYGRVLQLLESLRPEEGEEDLRGFGWRHLWRRAHPELRTLKGHEDLISLVHFLPDGERLVTASRDGTIRLWEVETGKLLGEHTQEEGVFSFFQAVSTDGKLLAQGRGIPRTEIRTLHIWAIPDGTESAWRLVKTFPSSTGVSALEFSPDGRSLVVAEWKGPLKVLDTGTWRAKAQAMVESVSVEHTIFSLAFAPTSDLLVTGDQRGEVVVWDPVSLSRIRELPKSRSVPVFMFSPDGKTLARTGSEGEIALVDPATWKRRGVLETQAAEVYRVQYVDANTLAIATRTEASVVELWGIDPPERHRVIRGHEEKTTWIAMHPDGVTMATGADDLIVKFWNLETPPEPLREALPGYLFYDAAVTRDGRHLIASRRDFALEVFEFEPRGRGVAVSHRGRIAWTADGRGGEALSPDGALVALAYGNKGVEIHSLQLEDGVPTSRRDAVLGATESGGGEIVDLEFSLDSRKLITADASGTVTIYERGAGGAQGWRSASSFDVELEDVEDIAMSPDSRTLAMTKRKQPQVYLWDIASGDSLRTLESHAEWVIALEFTADSRLLATGSVDKSAMLWDVETLRQRGPNEKAPPRPLKVFRGHTNAVTSLAFFPGDRVLASASDDATIKLWDIVTAEERATLRGHRGHVNSVVISPDGQSVVSAGGWKREYGAVMVWLAGER